MLLKCIIVIIIKDDLLTKTSRALVFMQKKR